MTPLWSIDLKGMVNGAVETCKESFHRFDKYLNFSNPLISNNFSPDACGWAFGMNMFDLKEWKKRNITGIYHRWQDMVNFTDLIPSFYSLSIYIYSSCLKIDFMKLVAWRFLCVHHANVYFVVRSQFGKPSLLFCTCR